MEAVNVLMGNGDSSSSARLRWLDGLRGIGALQVCLLHLSYQFGVSAPFSLSYELIDGQLAVFIFFYVSGYALCDWIAKCPRATGHLVAARIVRLFLPSLVALCFAFCIWLVLRLISQGSVGSLSQDTTVFGALYKIMLDAFLFVPVLGHRDSGLFNLIPIVGNIVRNHYFVLPILWTISIELFGSLILIVLCRIRASHERFADEICSPLVLVLTCKSLLFPFVVSYILRPSGMPRRSAALVGLAGLIFFLSLCTSLDAQNGHIYTMFDWMTQFPMTLPAQSGYSIQKAYAGLGIFGAVLAIPYLRTALSSRPCAFLGRISFPLYLVHYPLLSCMSAVRNVAAKSHFSDVTGLALGLGTFVLLTSVAVAAFTSVDDGAVALSRRILSTVKASAKPAIEKAA